MHARTEDLGRDCFSQGPEDFRPLPVFGRERTSITQLFDTHCRVSASYEKSQCFVR